MSTGLVPIFGGLITVLGSGLGTGAYFQLRSTKKRILAEAEKFRAEGSRTRAEAGTLAVTSLEDALTFYINELKDCRSGRAELRMLLDEREDILRAQGRRISELEEKVTDQDAHIAQLERRKDWRPDPNPEEGGST
jgi:chromosome segregation ATPase